jgi:RND family efflux transporter MFP subunit
MSAILDRLSRPVRALAARRGGVALMILGGTVALVALLVITRPEVEPVVQAERVWPVDVVTVTRQDLRPELALFGETVAGRRSELRALVAGPIVKVGPNFHEGGTVQAGELLLQVDPFDYEATLAERRAQLKEAEVRLEQLRRDYRRSRELMDRNLISQRDLDNAELAAEQQAAVVEQRRVEVRRAERDLADTRLTAPYGGVVGGVNADLGKHLNLNDKVADLIDISRMEVRFSLSNAQYGRLLASGEPVEGRAVEVSWQVGARTLQYPATVQRVGAEISATTGGVHVYAALDTRGLPVALRPGAFVQVRLPDREYQGVFQAPESALYGQDQIFVVKDDRLAERRIRVEGYAGNDLLFTAAGEPAVQDGDQVVTTQLREVGVGARVVIRDE